MKPRSKIQDVTAKDGGYLVRVKEPAQDGKANEAVISALARYFRLPKRAVLIVRGHQSRNKLVELLDTK